MYCQVATFFHPSLPPSGTRTTSKQRARRRRRRRPQRLRLRRESVDLDAALTTVFRYSRRRGRRRVRGTAFFSGCSFFPESRGHRNSAGDRRHGVNSGGSTPVDIDTVAVAVHVIWRWRRQERRGRRGWIRDGVVLLFETLLVPFGRRHQRWWSTAVAAGCGWGGRAVVSRGS